MKPIKTIIAVIAIASASATVAANDTRLAGLPKATAATEVGATKMPIGWYDFCTRHPEDCRVPVLQPQTVSLTPANWRTLVAINNRVNQAIEPITDMEHWGVAERWDYAPDGKGDCEDYVLVKRKMLMEAGFPRQALLITVVRDKKGDGHAVLTVVTDRGDFVLDNQNPQVLPWSATGYKFVKRQSRHDPNVWVSLGGPTEPPATASR